MSSFHTMPQFDNLPREIRWKVYRYTLKDTEVAELSVIPNERDEARAYVFKAFLPPNSNAIIRPKFCTALFTVNRKISEESREYFWRSNKFAAFEVNHDLIVRTIHSLVPLVIRRTTLVDEAKAAASNGHATYVHDVILRAKVSKIPQDHRQIYHSEPKVLIFAARHLPVLNRLLTVPWNDFGMRLAARSKPPMIVFNWNLKGGKYHFAGLEVDQIVLDNAAFHRVHSVSKFKTKHLRPDGWRFNLQAQWETIKGRTDPSQAILDDVLFWTKNGKAYGESGQNIVASSYYQMGESIARPSRLHEYVESVDMMKKIDQALFSLYEIWSDSLFAREKFGEAADCFNKAVLIADRHPLELKHDQFMSSLLTTLGTYREADNDLNEAFEAYRGALLLDPNNMMIKARARELVALWMEHSGLDVLFTAMEEHEKDSATDKGQQPHWNPAFW